MRSWLHNRGILFLSILLLLTLMGLTLLAGLVVWDALGLLILTIAAAACGIGFFLVTYRLIQLRWKYGVREARVLEQEMQETREQVFDLTEELRRKSDQLTTERDRAEFLREGFAELASSLEPRRVLDGILQRAIRATEARWGSIFLFDEQGRPSEVFFSRAYSASQINPRTAEVLERGLAGWVVRNRRGDMIFDTVEDPRWLSFPGDKEPARSAVAVPFLRRERVLGVMALTHHIPFHFSETHLSLLQELSQQAAVCLENADLYTMAEGERHKLAAILAGTTDAIIVVDMRGQVLLLNRAASRTFGVPAKEVLGRPLAEGVDHEALADLFSQALGRGEAITGELTTGDERVRFCSVSPIPGVGWVAVLQDITHLKELDRLKSEFVSTVSHDLRSPLTAVRGYADLIPSLGPVAEGQHNALERIRRAVGQMDELIGDLLDLGKIEAGIDMQVSPCDLVEITAEAVDGLMLRAELKEIDLQVEVEKDLPLIMGNAARLRQVVTNLVSNAIKYTPSRGRIRVRLARRGQEAILAVADTGLGIAPQDQQQLFQKFYRVQTPETAGIMGTGLGLAICRSIVEHHGGRIWVRSALGKGSTFAFALPVLEDAEQAEGAGEAEDTEESEDAGKAERAEEAEDAEQVEGVEEAESAEQAADAGEAEGVEEAEDAEGAEGVDQAEDAEEVEDAEQVEGVGEAEETEEAKDAEKGEGVGRVEEAESAGT